MDDLENTIASKAVEVGLPLVGQAISAIIAAVASSGMSPEQLAEVDRELGDEMKATHERLMTRDAAQKERNAAALDAAAKKFGKVDEEALKPTTFADEEITQK